MSEGRFDVKIIREAHRCKQCGQAVYNEHGEHSEDLEDYKAWILDHVDKNGRAVKCSGKIDQGKMERVL